MRGSILVVDDQVGPRHLLASELEEAGYAVVEAGDGNEGWVRFCEDEPDLVITDLMMPHCDGHDLLCRIRGRSSVPVIVVSAHGSVSAAVRIIQAGASDFLATDEVDVSEVVSRAGAVTTGRAGPGRRSELERRLPGTSAAINRVRMRVEGLAPLRHPVLVRGEAGTGRGEVVRAIHELGATADGPLLRIDCARWDTSRGLPRAAAVHLDGVESLAPTAQAFWADVIAGRARPSGPRAPRVLASSGPAFEAATAGRGSPAAALAAELLRFPIELPPLRDRPEDVGPIADAIVERIGGALGRPARLSDEARVLLAGRRWRGNVAQLERLLERAVAFTTEERLEAAMLGELMSELEDGLGAIRRLRVERERDALLAALRESGGNVSRAAAILGRSRGAVYRLMQKHGVTRADSH